MTSGCVTADFYVEVYSALSLALSKTTRRTFVVIDALDESQDAENLLQALFEAKHVAGERATMLNTSRQMELPCSFDENVSLNSKMTKHPIQKYVGHGLLQMKTLSDTVLRLMIVRQIVCAADSLCLHARLTLDEIEKLPSAALIQRHLRNIPLGLTQLCNQIVLSKESTLAAMDLKFAQQVLLWFDLSAYCSTFVPKFFCGLRNFSTCPTESQLWIGSLQPSRVGVKVVLSLL